MSSTIRIGMIGAGGIAGAHVQYLKPIAGVEVVALADPRPGACENLAKQQGLSNVKMFADYHDLLALKEIDAVSVCTPNWLHAKPTIEALKAGKHVMVEKPLAMNAKEGEAMCAAAKRAKRVLSIGFQHRFRPEAQFIRRLIAEGALGKIIYCRAQALRRRGIPSWGVFGQKKLQGGGPMIDIGVHILELSHFLMGKPQPEAAVGACYTYLGNRKPDATAPWGDWDYKTYTVEDLATGFVRFAGGLSLVIESSFAAHIEKDVFATTILGTKGGAVMGDDGVKVFTDMSGKMVNIAPAFVGRDDAFAVKMRSWIEAIRGAPNPAPGEDGLVIQKILDAIYASAEKGHEVAIR
ncbi:MAG: Gfo/Idh/MocA family oxidoreductase [Planctomycetota bacterium]|nr:Gfo/Idh/MocA family oxidoreductase [Planctomycetota bacterium]